MSMSTGTRYVPYVSEDTEHLLLWRDVRRTGIVFGICTAIFAFFRFSKLPLVSIVLYTLALLVALCTLWARFGKTIGRPMPEMPAYLRQGISEADYKAYCDKAKPHIDEVTGIAHGIITCKNFPVNAKLFGALLVLGKLLAYFNALTLAYFVIFVVFVGPKAYEQNKDKIDEFLAKGREQSQKAVNVAKAEFNKAADKVPALRNMANNVQAAAKKKE